jgi:hypothetical protein
MQVITNPMTRQGPFRNTGEPARAQRKNERGEARIILVVLAAFLLGSAAGAFWAHRSAGPGAPLSPDPSMTQTAGLSQSSKTVLSHLAFPVEIRFYSVLDPASTPDPMRAFASRVEAMLVAFQHEASGKITLTRSNSQSYANMTAATRDGIKPFNEDKGEPSFLGITVFNQDRKASLAQLSPEWEPALEYDIARTIQNTLNTSAPMSAPAVTAPKLDSDLVQEIKRTIPNVESLSLAEATRMLREASITEFSLAAKQFQTQLSQAQERLKGAQNGGSEAGQQAAIKDLQQVQAEQAARLKEIAAKAQAQIEALKLLKSGSR